jgi:hypothetical protein
MVIAREGGETTTLLGILGSNIRVQEGTLLSVDSGYPTPASVIGYRATDDPLLGNTSTLVLNYPSTLTGGTTLMQSSVLSWIDLNGDQRVNANETLQSYPVLVREDHGRGTLYVLGNPGIFLNAMMSLDRGDNAVFIQNLLTARPRLLLEQAHSHTTVAEAPSSC